MSNLIPIGMKAAKNAAKYGPQAKMLWDTAGKAATEQVKVRRARAADKKHAVEKARTVIAGTVLRQIHGEQVVWVVYAGDEPIAAYPAVDVGLGELTKLARLDDRFTPEDYDASLARARARRLAARARRRRTTGSAPAELASGEE